MKRVDVLFAGLASLICATGCNSSTATMPAARSMANGALQPGALQRGAAQHGAIQHIVIMMQENRSFNNIFAGFPGATTAMEGPCKPEPSAPWCKGDHIVKLHSVPLKTGKPNFGDDIDHSHRAFKIECDANASGVCQMDGFDLIHKGESGQEGSAKLYPYAYLDRKETAPYWKLAQQYALADKMFLTDTASSFIAHQLILSGTVRYNGHESLTDQPFNTPWGCDAAPGDTVPLLFLNGYENFNGVYPCFTQYRSIAELLDAADVSWQFYVQQGLYSKKPYFDFSGAAWNGFDAIAKVRCATFTPPYGCHGYGADWKHISTPNTNVFSDVKAGRLPAVSWVIPTIFDSDHPASGCNGGPRWVTRVINAIGTSKYWKNTAIILFWDDWGGWYDPVPPRQFNYTSLGMRIPMILISPYAKPHFISETTYNYGSILKFVEETFKLGSLGTTDKTANSLADSFDYSQPPNGFKAAPWPPRSSCPPSSSGNIIRQIIEHDGGVPE